MPSHQTGGQASQGNHDTAVKAIKRKAMKRKVPKSRREKPLCLICSNKEILGLKTEDIYHHHFSSKVVRDCCTNKESGNCFCPSCKVVHGHPSENDRLRIIIAASSLHEFWNPREEGISYPGDSSHADYLTIPGARINELTTAWELIYFQEKRPMDIFLSAGHENLLKGQSVNSIMVAIKHFIDLVEYQAEKFHPNSPNTCVIGTLYYPPRLCWLPNNGNMPHSYVNHYDEMKELNGKIEALNMKHGLKAPNFPTMGIRIEKIYGRPVTKHRWQHWKEVDRTEKLHLIDSLRIKTAQQIHKYFDFSC